LPEDGVVFVAECFIALLLGIQTSILPCPLATNIAAISFIGKQVSRPGAMLWSGAFYTLGRSATYVALGAAIVWVSLADHTVSNFLQEYMNKILGPLLIVTGMILLDLLSLKFSLNLGGAKLQAHASRAGVLGAGLLGIVFALSLCGPSAGIFLGVLIPKAIEHQSVIILPLLYGVGTALPVLVFAVLLSLGGRAVGKAYDRLTQVERWLRRITGAVFILVGVYYSLRYIFELPIP